MITTRDKDVYHDMFQSMLPVITTPSLRAAEAISSVLTSIDKKMVDSTAPMDPMNVCIITL